MRARQSHPEGPRLVRAHECDVAEESFIKCFQCSVAVGLGDGSELTQHIRVSAYRSLSEDDHRTRQYIGALDRDRDRDLLVGVREIVAGSHADAFAAMQV